MEDLSLELGRVRRLARISAVLGAVALCLMIWLILSGPGSFTVSRSSNGRTQTTRVGGGYIELTTEPTRTDRGWRYWCSSHMCDHESIPATDGN